MKRRAVKNKNRKKRIRAAKLMQIIREVWYNKTKKE